MLSSLGLPLLAILAGFAGLVWSADRFVAGSAAIARHAGVSRIVIGLTIVSLGTSAPEIMVSANAALANAGDIAIGNALGSNLANIGLVLAITALIAPIPIHFHLLRQEGPVLLLITLAAGVCLYDGTLSRLEGSLLLLGILPLLALTIWFKRRHPSSEVEHQDLPSDMGKAAAWLWFFLGLGLLLISSDFLVWGAKSVAEAMGVSPLIIGLTVIAIGTSLPELAASVASALKGHHDIAIGNIVGSNIFNILAVMSLPGLIDPLSMDSVVFYRDYMAMLLMTVLLLLAMWLSWKLPHNRRPQLGRTMGSLLLAGYVFYYLILLPQAGISA